jgi:intracellular sulfur oxidation DsrE/DsrF family protein
MSVSDASSRLARRGFLARLSAAAGAAALLSAPRPLHAALAPAPRVGPEDPDAWIDRVRGRDRLLLHAHQRLLQALGAAHGILTDARESYGVPERENGIAVAAHGPAIGGLFTDETWKRFALAERYGVAAKDGAATNPFLRPQEGAAPEATVPALMERGVLFVVCNVAVRNLSRRIAPAGEPAEPVQEALRAGLLPGVVVVPNVFVAISHAQRRGIGYLFID